MEQPAKLPKGLCGAGGDELVEGHDLAIEAFGEQACKSACLGAFAYLWRRFGPPLYGSDSHKDVCQYILTTADPDVFLTLRVVASGLQYGAGYLADKKFREEWHRPFTEWEGAFNEWWCAQHPEIDVANQAAWSQERKQEVSEQFWKARNNSAIVGEAKGAIGPYPSRDCGPWRESTEVRRRVNQALWDALQELLRPCYVRDVPINLLGKCDDSADAVPHSKYAGYGVDVKPMDEMIAEEEGD